MEHIDIWKMLEDIVENNDPPYCFEPCELQEIQQCREEHLQKMRKKIVEVGMVLLK